MKKEKKIPHRRNCSKSNTNIVKTEPKSIPLPRIHDNRSLFWLCTCTSIKSGGVKLVLWAQDCRRSEMIRSVTISN